MIDLLFWAGTALGIIGTVFVSCKKPKWGQLIWLVSNPFLIVASVMDGNKSMVVLFSVYTLVSIIGVYNYFIKK